MNILYITPSFPFEKDGDNTYTDLAEEIAKKHNIKIVVATEKSKIEKTQINVERGIECLRVRTGNLYNVGVIEKAISFITLQSKLKKAIKEFLSNEKFDLVLFMAPPVTLGNVIKYAMKKYGAMSYLMQKDIFPQNALDLKMMTKKNPAYWYFRLKEKGMYKTATVIGCMSQGNIDFLLDNNKFLNKDKLEIFSNTMKCIKKQESENSDIREKYKISKDKVLAIYGGNFGKPQGVPFIKKVLDEYKNNEKVTFAFFGKGTEKKKLKNHIKENNIENVLMFDFIPRNEYFQILQQADIGFVFLDYRFTIPNIPSRTLSYFENSIPIMAATDKNTDYKDILKSTNSGLWCESNNVKQFKEQFDKLIESKELRNKLGSNGKKYLETKLTSKKSVEILEKAYEKVKEEEQNV